MNNVEVLAGLLDGLDAIDRATPDEAKTMAALFYRANEAFKTELTEYKALVQAKASAHRRGRQMERVMGAAFAGLRGRQTAKSYQSLGPQIDLYLNSDLQVWRLLQQYLGIERAGIIVEAKATKDRVDEPTFARLCSVIRDNFSATVGLGVFFTHAGATGTRGLRDARLRQLIFYCRTGVPVVVLDLDDIETLDKPGSLPFMLRLKREEIEVMPLEPERVTTTQVDLPSHLEDLLGE